MSDTETITLVPTRVTQRLQGTPDHPAIAAGTSLWVGEGSVYAQPFEVYLHRAGPKGDWGVQDIGRFHDSITHGWTQLGAAQQAVLYYRNELDKRYPVGSGARYGLGYHRRGLDLVCSCPLELDGKPYPCHADVLLDIARDVDARLQARISTTSVSDTRAETREAR